MGKTRDLFKKIRDTKGTFHANTGSIKGRNGIDLTEAENIKKRWQEYTQWCPPKCPSLHLTILPESIRGAIAASKLAPHFPEPPLK